MRTSPGFAVVATVASATIKSGLVLDCGGAPTNGVGEGALAGLFCGGGPPNGVIEGAPTGCCDPRGGPPKGVIDGPPAGCCPDAGGMNGVGAVDWSRPRHAVQDSIAKERRKTRSEIRVFMFTPWFRKLRLVSRILSRHLYSLPVSTEQNTGTEEEESQAEQQQKEKTTATAHIPMPSRPVHSSSSQHHFVPP
jgi:hypothetical protein